MEKRGQITPSNGGCWFCYDVPTSTKDKGFSMELDTYFHFSCLKRELNEHPDNMEATLIAKEFGLM